MRTIRQITLSLLIGCTAFGQSSPRRDFLPVSLVSLIATPEKYDGKFVYIEGIACFDNKNSINAVFLTRDDKLAGNGQNGIFVYFASSIKAADRLSNKYVFVRGQFRPNVKGRLGSFSGSLVDVDRVYAVNQKVK